MLKLQNISTKFLKNISLELDIGDVFNVIGPNGAGKSTIGKVLSGLEIINNGKIIYNNIDITNYKPEERAKIGLIYVMQNIPFYSSIEIESYYKIFLGEKNYPVELFEKFGLNWNDYKNRKFDDTLSGGERKKIEFILNISLDGKLYILDEIDSGLDIFSVSLLKDVVLSMKLKGKSFIIISHNNIFQEISNKGMVLCDGIIKKIGNIELVVDYYNSKCFTCQEFKSIK